MRNFPTTPVCSEFRDRECWPVTGPIYGFLDEDDFPKRPKRRFWQRWLLGEEDDEERENTGPISPIHY